MTERSTVNWESTLTLDKGSSADVEAGDCVITETGVLVGVVSKVGYNWSTVSTVIDTGIEMGGIVSRTYSAGILEGSFDLMSQGKLRLSYLPEGAQLVSGDEVLTSGRGDVYPSGLVVGQVEGVFTAPPPASPGTPWWSPRPSWTTSSRYSSSRTLKSWSERGGAP